MTHLVVWNNFDCAYVASLLILTIKYNIVLITNLSTPYIPFLEVTSFVAAKETIVLVPIQRGYTTFLNFTVFAIFQHC